ncbi:MAG: hypothetical protein M1813_001364 [Trichoglossum hirsutum]|nr:MAG: hypothetical protein M1813_001364 [Trichoglossum hirsutum]
MTSFPTVPAFVHSGDWNEASRAHPVAKSVEAIADEFDTTNRVNPKWYTADPYLQKTDGSECQSLQEVIAAVEQMYEPFTSHHHEPHLITIVEADHGYRFLGLVRFFGNLAGTPAAGESKVKDRSGKEWDIVVMGTYSALFVKDEKAENGLGVAIKKTEIMADGSMLAGIMLKRGLISA